MKHIFLLIALFFASLLAAQSNDSSSSKGASGPIYKHLVNTNPVLNAIGWLNVKYEYILSEKASIVAAADAIVARFAEDLFRGGVGLGYRRYFTYRRKPIPNGFYFQPQVRIFFGGKNSDAVVPGFELGYQWVWGSGFSLDLGIGPGLYIFDEAENVVAPTGTINFGYAW